MEARTLVIVKEKPAKVIGVAGKQGPAGTPNPAYGDIEALENLAGTGVAVRTGNEAWALRTIAAPAAGLSISDPVAGNIVFALANDLLGLEGLVGVGFAKKIGVDTWALGYPTAAEVGADPLGTAGANIAAHVAALDPHPQYRLEADAIPFGVIVGLPTTLAGYGILDAYTKIQTDAAIAAFAVDAYTKAQSDARFAPIAVPWASLTGVPATFTPAAHNQAWATITATPTTVAGYAITDVYTKTAGDARYAPIAVPWASLTGVPATFPPDAHNQAWATITATPTTATGYGILTINAITVGLTTPAQARFLNVGINQAIGADHSLYIGRPTGAGISIRGVEVDYTAPATATAQAYGYLSRVTTSAAAFVCGSIIHFYALGAAIGAGSTVTQAIGFIASNGIAIGTTNNYGFYSDIALNANVNLQLCMAGTGRNYVNGGLMINAISGAVGCSLQVAGPVDGTTNRFGIRYVATNPVGGTGMHWGISASIATAAAAFTLAALNNFMADSNTLGAGSAVTAVHGFHAAAAICIGATNVGFYSDLAFVGGQTNYQFHAAGNAPSYFQGPIGVLSVPAATLAATDSLIKIGTGGAQHPGTVASVFVLNVGILAPITATGGLFGVSTTLGTAASAFSCVGVYHFNTGSISKGAGSTIGEAIGFRATQSGVALGTNNYGFWSNLTLLAGTYQIYMSGTAASWFNGPVGIGTAASDPIGQLALFQLNGTHPVTGNTTLCMRINVTAPATSTTAVYGHYVILVTAAAAFVVANLSHFSAVATTKGAGSTINNVWAFSARDGIVNPTAGCTSVGFYADILIPGAGVAYQFQAAGTAASSFKGGIICDTTAAPACGANQVSIGGTIATTVGAAGGAAALPATPQGYWIINVAGTSRKVPFYAT